MFFLNLTALEFFSLLGVLSASITALYFLDRSKRKRTVSTLQFWSATGVAVQQRSRKRVNQPLSLLLQLVSLVLLLLAIAQLQVGHRLAAGRSHVLMIDTSAWSSAHTETSLVLNEEIQTAMQYVTALPKQDRVLVAGVDALVTPVTGFLRDREQTFQALRGLSTHLSALDLPAAFRYAEHAQTGLVGPVGEVVYVGPARINAAAEPVLAPNNLRVLPIDVANNNVGIRGVSANVVENAPGTWQARVKLYNFTTSPKPVKVDANFAGTPFAVRSVTLAPKQEAELTYRFVTSTAGLLTVRLDNNDSLSGDNRASLELPGDGPIQVIAYSLRPQVLRPLLESNPRLSVRFEPSSKYISKPTADLLVLDAFTPHEAPAVPSIWLDPGQLPPNLSVSTTVEKTSISNWNDDGLLSSGLHSRNQEITHATIFKDSRDYLPFASAAEGSIVVLGRAHPRSAVVGFDPLQPKLRFTVLTPLLFANLIQWVAPELDVPTDVRAEEVGALSLPLSPGETVDNVKLTTMDGTALPFTIGEQSLKMFVDKPTVVRLRSGSRDQYLSLTLPNVGEGTWKPTSTVPLGIPPTGLFDRQPLDLWKWLALSAAMGLFAEWYLFGRVKFSSVRASVKPSAMTPETQPQHEMVNR